MSKACTISADFKYNFLFLFSFNFQVFVFFVVCGTLVRCYCRLVTTILVIGMFKLVIKVQYFLLNKLRNFYFSKILKDCTKIRSN
jgi:hypothetical protein